MTAFPVHAYAWPHLEHADRKQRITWSLLRTNCRHLVAHAVVTAPRSIRKRRRTVSLQHQTGTLLSGRPCVGSGLDTESWSPRADAIARRAGSCSRPARASKTPAPSAPADTAHRLIGAGPLGLVRASATPVRDQNRALVDSLVITRAGARCCSRRLLDPRDRSGQSGPAPARCARAVAFADGWRATRITSPSGWVVQPHWRSEYSG